MEKKILFNQDLLLDIICKKDKTSIELFEKLQKLNFTLYITSSMIPKIADSLSPFHKKKLSQVLSQKFKVITTTGIEGIKSLDSDYTNNTLLCLSFKRICNNGIIVTKDKNFVSSDFKIYSPKELLEDLNKEKFKHTQSFSMVDLKAQYHEVMEEIDQRLLKVLSDSKYILGPEVEELENKFSEYFGVRYCITVASGTDALLLSLRALAILKRGKEFWEKRDEIITTPFTFIATADTIVRAGAKPVFADIDLKGYNIDPKEIEKAINSNTVGIVPVHLYGLSCQMDKITEIAKRYNLFVLEDAAQAFGARWKDKKIGTIGEAGCFSFFPSKNLGCFGDGGLVITNNKELSEIIRLLRVHGGKDNIRHIGYKARLDTIQAAILLTKLKYIDKTNLLRREIASYYNTNLKKINFIITPFEPKEAYHIYHQYTIRVLHKKREQLQRHLHLHNIPSRIYYPTSLHKMEVFKQADKKSKKFPKSEKATQEVLSLPIDPFMSQDSLKIIVEKIKEFA
jgi:dTDP-4-amino-4,6-dideoxygalactose transaminase